MLFFEHQNKTYIFSLIIAILTIINTSGCSIYKMNIRQGNDLELDKLNQLKPRMTKKQVQDILGTANLIPINPNRLDYCFSNSIKQPKKEHTSKHLILYFDNNGELNHYEGNFKLKHLPTNLNFKAQDPSLN